MSRITIELYIHADNESTYDKVKKAGLTGAALDNAARLGYEHKMTYSVDPETGSGTLVAVDDIPLRFSTGLRCFFP